MKRSTLLALTLSAAFLAACGGGGGDAPAITPPMAVTSTSFVDGEVIPAKYAAVAQTNGQNTSPALSIANVPASTQFLAIVMDDETLPCGAGADACIHWGVFNLPSTKFAIEENENLAAIQNVVLGSAYNSLTGYQGPNPPSNHTYKITVYALSSAAVAVQSTPVPKYTRSTFETAFSGKILDKVTISGRFPQ